MSGWWSWARPRTAEEKRRSRQERIDFYNKGTVTSGKYAGRYVAELQGQKEPRGTNIRELLTELSTAADNSFPINHILPGPLPFAVVKTPGIPIDPIKEQPTPVTTTEEPTGLITDTVTKIKEAITDRLPHLNWGAGGYTDTVNERAQRNKGLSVEVSDYAKPVSGPGSEDQFLRQAREATADDLPVLGHNPISEEVETAETASGQQTKQPFTVGGDSDPMLSWLAQVSPQVLAALAAGAGGQLAAVAAKKIVGDAVPPTEAAKQGNTLGFTESDLAAILSASRRLGLGGVPATSSAALAAKSPDPISLGSGQAIPAPDQGQAQTIADSAIQIGTYGVPEPLQKSQPLLSASALLAKAGGMSPKLTTNQDTVIIPPNATGPQVVADPAVPAPAPASFGSQLMKIGGQVGTDLKAVAKDSAIDAVQNVASEVLGAAAPGISTLTQAAGKRLGGWFGRGIKSIMQAMTRKVVGDAPMPGTTGRVKKIVGDPPLMDDTEHAIASVATNNSPLVTMMAARMLMEQLLTTMVPVPLSGSKVDILRAIINASNPDMSLFNNEPLDTDAERSGMTLWPRAIIYYDQNTPAGWYYMRQNPPVARAGLVSPEQAVPLTETATAASVAPMLIGAPLTEYSGALRIKTMRTDMDQLMTVLGRAVPELLADKGYSFARPLSVLLLMATHYGLPFGSEATELLSGVAYRVTANTPVPLTQPFPMLMAQPWGGLFAWVTLREYVEALNGYAMGPVDGVNGPWNELFRPDQWDGNCAIVPIYREEMTDGQGNLVRALAALEHPYLAMVYPIQWMKLSADGYVPEAGGMPDADMIAHTNASLTRIEGPTSAVLFVVVDMPSRRTGVVEVGFAGEMVLTEAHNPANPHVGGADFTAAARFAMGTTMFMEEITAQIQRLERSVVTASDRASAMRLVADTVVRYGQPKTYARRDPGDLDFVGGLQSAYDNETGLPMMYRIQADAMFISFRDEQLTTPSGRLLPAWNGVGTAPNNTQITHRVAHYSSLLHVTLMRGLVHLEEEKAQQPLAALPAVCEVIYEMAVVQAAISDRVLQDNSQTVRDWIGPPDREYDIRNTLRGLNHRNIVRPEMVSTWMAGIQYPAATVVYDQMDALPRPAVWDATYPGAVDECPFGRVTAVGLNRYFGGLVPMSPIINLHGLMTASQPQYRQIRVEIGAAGRVYMNEFWALEGQATVEDEMRKITFSAIPDERHLNPAIRVVEWGNYDAPVFLAMPITAPDSAWSRAVAYSPYNNNVVDMRAECTSLPVGAMLPLYYVDRAARRSYLVRGYSDMFRMPNGSAAIRILTAADTAAGLVNADIFPEEFGHLYNRPGLVASVM